MSKATKSLFGVIVVIVVITIITFHYFLSPITDYYLISFVPTSVERQDPYSERLMSVGPDVKVEKLDRNFENDERAISWCRNYCSEMRDDYLRMAKQDSIKGFDMGMYHDKKIAATEYILVRYTHTRSNFNKEFIEEMSEQWTDGMIDLIAEQMKLDAKAYKIELNDI